AGQPCTAAHTAGRWTQDFQEQAGNRAPLSASLAGQRAESTSGWGSWTGTHVTRRQRAPSHLAQRQQAPSHLARQQGSESSGRDEPRAQCWQTAGNRGHPSSTAGTESSGTTAELRGQKPSHRVIWARQRAPSHLQQSSGQARQRVIWRQAPSHLARQRAPS
ncbi:unnamed protein product, partial [Staurois parvus]